MNALSLNPPRDALFAPGRRAALVGAVALVSMLAFEAMAVAAAMPAIALALDGLALYALAFGGTLASSVLGMVVAGASCDRRGPWRTTAWGLGIFMLGLLLAGLAPQMDWLVAGRVVQGLGGGMLSVALYAGMGPLVPEAQHPRMFALFAAAWVLPGLVGPLLAAWLTEQLGWRAVFLCVAAAVPLAAALLLPAFRRLSLPCQTAPTVPLWRQARIGWAALAACGALALHSASQAGSVQLALPILVLGLAAALLAAGRLLPPGTLRAAAGLPAVIALRGLLVGAFFSAEVFIPLYLGREQGWSLAQAGLALSAAAVCWSAGSALQARLQGSPARRRGLQTGFLMLAAGIAWVATPLLFGLAPAWVVAGWALAGFGTGLSFPMLSVLTLGLSAPAQRGSNASALQLSDALGTSASLAVAGALFNQAGAGALSHLLVLGLASSLALLGLVLGPRAFR